MAVCPELTKSGEPCKANPRSDTGKCNAHSPKEVQRSSGFGGPQPGSGRPRNPRAVDLLREKLEAEFPDWWKVLADARTAERGVVVGDGDSARVEFFADHPTRLKAFRELVDRAYGRPMQFHDVTTREEESEVDREIRELLEQMDRLPSNGKTPAHANGNGNGKH